MNKIAQHWAMYMSKFNHFSHTSIQGVTYSDILPSLYDSIGAS